jgi:hypothetical protein
MRTAAIAVRRYGHIVHRHRDHLALADRPRDEGECKWPPGRHARGRAAPDRPLHPTADVRLALAMRVVPLKAVQELPGHATIEMNVRYAHLSPTVWRDAVQVLGPGE